MMNSAPEQIKFIWNDPVTGSRQESLLNPPIALGRDPAKMPPQVRGRVVSNIIINDVQVHGYHVLIDIVQGQLKVIYQNTNGLSVNGVRQNQPVLASGDLLLIGTTEIELSFILTTPAIPPTQIPVSPTSPTSPISPPLTQIPSSSNPAPSNYPAQSNPQEVRLRWDEPATSEVQENIFIPPIGFGRELAQIPNTIPQNNRIILNSDRVSRYHALIEWENEQLVVIDQGSINHIFVNNVEQKQAVLNSGDTLQIGPYQISVGFGSSSATKISFIAAATPPQSTPKTVNFPPHFFLQTKQVAVQDLHATGYAVDEADYGAVGAGLGSFIWVDLLRIWGVKKEQIRALGLQPQPYARYKELCLNSQIPLDERLRSNSDSCPDNIWGFPSYAWREAWHDFRMGQINKSFKYLWQVFSEPDLIETYTPRAGNVFNSIDREAQRIGWNQIYNYGSVRSIRQTNDGRYAIAYSSGQGNYAFLIAKYVYLATGYPAIRFLPDLQIYRQETGDSKSVVNAYENHNHVYEYLEKNGGMIMIRGRGIVASRIIQRIYEIRKKKGKKINILHLLRSPLAQGHKFGLAQRPVKYHQEFQPFNWPKACWGGDLRVILEKANPDTRQNLLNDWGGTTTADRQDWQRMVNEGFNEGWYKLEFGEVIKVEPKQPQGTITYIRSQEFGETKLEADFIIDATGLDAKINESPLLNDLQTNYSLPLNSNQRLTVNNSFELAGMRNQKGRMYAAGTITLGGPYAAVDSFLGLQYAALCSVDNLAVNRATGVRYLNGLNSWIQWCKWITNQSP